MFFVFLSLLQLLQAQDIKIPYPILPINETLPSLNSETLVFVVGCRGIAREVAVQSYNLGATVTCTTRNLNTFDSNSIPSGISVFELEYGRKDSERKVVKDFMQEYHRNPDHVFDIGLDNYIGDLLSFTDDELYYMADVYYLGHIRLEREFMKFNNASIPMTWSYSLSSAGSTRPPVFIELYSQSHTWKVDHIIGQNAAKKYPNVRFLGVMCSFTNTTFALTSFNPSALEGDKVQIAYQNANLFFTPLIGVNPAVVAKAHLQATFLSEELDKETIFWVPSLLGRSSSDAWYTDTVLLSGKNASIAFTNRLLTEFGLNVTDH